MMHIALRKSPIKERAQILQGARYPLTGICKWYNLNLGHFFSTRDYSVACRNSIIRTPTITQHQGSDLHYFGEKPLNQLSHAIKDPNSVTDHCCNLSLVFTRTLFSICCPLLHVPFINEPDHYFGEKTYLIHSNQLLHATKDPYCVTDHCCNLSLVFANYILNLIPLPQVPFIIIQEPFSGFYWR